MDEPDPLGCWDPDVTPAGPLQNRGTEYDWARFLWALTKGHPNTIQQVWDLWVAADPASWDANGGTLVGDDDPVWRMAAASGPITGYGPEAATYGLDHW